LNIRKTAHHKRSSMDRSHYDSMAPPKRPPSRDSSISVGYGTDDDDHHHYGTGDDEEHRTSYRPPQRSSSPLFVFGDEEQEQVAVCADVSSDGSSSLSDSEDEWELKLPEAPVPAPFGTKRNRGVGDEAKKLPKGQRKRSSTTRRGSSGEMDPESLRNKPFAAAAALKPGPGVPLDQSDTALSYQKDQWSNSGCDKDEEPKRKTFGGLAKAGAAIAVMGGIGYKSLDGR
jgi:hypothetical protein